MISNDITGNAGGDASQVFNLLAVVANPDMYAKKLTEMVNATEANKKFVALVGPANEILQLRDEAKKDREEAKKELLQAKTDAAAAKDTANLVSKDIMVKAESDAAKIRQETEALKDAQAALVQEAKTLKADLVVSISKANARERLANAATDEQVKAAELLKAEQQSYKDQKAKLVALTNAYIAELVK
jgi:hypothetical protein